MRSLCGMPESVVDFAPNPEQELLIGSVRRLVDSRIAPAARAAETRGAVAPETWNELLELGLLELARGDAGLAVAVASHLIASRALTEPGRAALVGQPSLPDRDGLPALTRTLDGVAPLAFGALGAERLVVFANRDDEVVMT